MKNKPDTTLIILYILLMLIGWISIYSTKYYLGDFSIDSSYGLQLIWIGCSSFLGACVFFIDKRIYYNFALYIYLFLNLLVLLVFFVGVERSGARSWLGIGGFGIQPAEFAKYGACLLMARFTASRACDLTKVTHLLFAAIIILIPACLILLQNDTGSAIPFLFLVFALFREGLNRWIFFAGFLMIILFILLLYMSHWIILIITSSVFLLLIIYLIKKKRNIFQILMFYIFVAGYTFLADYAYDNVLQPHQRKRIELVFGKIDDPKGIGYNVRQSKIAIGSGGLTGQGFGQGTQTQLNFVPEQSTDFIFSAIGEEWGFIGCVSVILLYCIFIGRIIFLSEKKTDPFTRAYGYCIASMFFAHVAINIGMTIGLMPVIGIPLPLLSYGGSSLFATTLMLFTFINLKTKQ